MAVKDVSLLYNPYDNKQLSTKKKRVYGAEMSDLSVPGTMLILPLLHGV